MVERRRLNGSGAAQPSDSIRDGDNAAGRGIEVTRLSRRALRRNAECAAKNDFAEESLAEIADRIRNAHRRTALSIIAIGRDLISVKERLPHKQFLAWIALEFGMEARTAQNYMGAARMADKNESVSLLPPTTIYRLASPWVPTETRQEILAAVKADVEKGQKVDHAEIRRELDNATLEARNRRRKKGRIATATRAQLEKEMEGLRCHIEELEGARDDNVLPCEEALEILVEHWLQSDSLDELLGAIPGLNLADVSAFGKALASFADGLMTIRAARVNGRAANN